MEFFIIGFILVISLIWYFAIRFEKKRAQKLENFAMQRGFKFTIKPEKIFLNMQFSLFKKGHSKKASGLMEKGNLQIFDYKYTTGGGKSSSTHNQTVIVKKLENSIPRFTLAPEYFFHKLGKLFGVKDINFPSNPAFSKKFLLRGENESDIRSYFSQDKLVFLQRLQSKIIIESNSQFLLYFIPNKRTKNNDFDQFLVDFNKIASLFDK